MLCRRGFFFCRRIAAYIWTCDNTEYVRILDTQFMTTSNTFPQLLVLYSNRSHCHICEHGVARSVPGLHLAKTGLLHAELLDIFDKRTAGLAAVSIRK